MDGGTTTEDEDVVAAVNQNLNHCHRVPSRHVVQAGWVG